MSTNMCSFVSVKYKKRTRLNAYNCLKHEGIQQWFHPRRTGEMCSQVLRVRTKNIMVRTGPHVPTSVFAANLDSDNHTHGCYSQHCKAIRALLTPPFGLFFVRGTVHSKGNLFLVF